MVIGEVKAFVKENPVLTGGAIIGTTAALGTAAYFASRRRKKKTTKKKSNSTKRKNKKRTYKYARTAGKRKDTSKRRIRMTKNGQPYVILRSGKARFIKKSSARNSRRRKGGRY